jgi:hypothetical protein
VAKASFSSPGESKAVSVIVYFLQNFS